MVGFDVGHDHFQQLSGCVWADQQGFVVIEVTGSHCVASGVAHVFVENAVFTRPVPDLHIMTIYLVTSS